MWTRGLQRLPWQLACVLFAAVASADIVASNENTTMNYDGKIFLQDNNGNNLTQVVPLSQEAAVRNLDGELYLTTDQNYLNISNGDIAFISCNEDDYRGNLQPDSIFMGAYSNHNISGAILYSTATDYCNYTDAQPSLQQFPIYSMSNKGDSQKIVDQLQQQPVSSKYFAKVVRSGTGNVDQSGQQNGQDSGQQNPLGPSPSTAVAMIILYSITGIITALFLVIIITGAVRAHRHPDRYGPRDVLGRPRQSRARGLGRAILDTIPIVKFGEKEPPKPATDVELGSTSETRDVNATGADASTQNAQPATEERRASQTETTRDAPAEEQSGIAPAEPVAAGAATVPTNTSAEEGLGCSICTDDFEKGQDIRVLPCNHKFHPECVDPWLLNVSGTCPLCRVDLRPVQSNTSDDDDDPDANPDHDPNTLAPPLQSDNDVSHRRRSMLRDLVSFRSRPDASADERISALRRLREQRRNRSGEVAEGSANASSDDVAGQRRSKRMSVRLSDVFSGRRRGREDSPGAEGSANASGRVSVVMQPQQQQQNTPEREESPGPSGSGSNGTGTRPAEEQR